MKRAGNQGVPNRIDYFGTDLFASGRIPRPKNYYFVTEMRKDRQNELYIPRHVIKDFAGIQLPDEMMVVDPYGRIEPIKRQRWLDGRTVYNGRWRAICKWNFARPGDKIVCEFVRSDTGDLQLSMTVVPSDRPQE